MTRKDYLILKADDRVIITEGVYSRHATIIDGCGPFTPKVRYDGNDYNTVTLGMCKEQKWERK